MCDFPLCPYPSLSTSIYCFHHNRKFGTPIPKMKAAKRIAPLSKKRVKMQREEYVPMVKQMLSEDPTCHVKKSPQCNNLASGLQHLVKRSAKNLCDPKNVIRCCTPCQNWIEENSLEAIAAGVSKSKYSN